jgi:uracil-DNA glycosylase family 4
MGSGSKKATIMIVGEAPGAREDEKHTAFVGPAGKLLTELLEAEEILRDDCYITNAVKCRPSENATPSRQDVKACLPYLATEIGQVQPQIIISLGNTALQALTGRSGITKHRGRPVQLGDATVIPTFHPAAALRSSHYLPHIKADLRAAKRILSGDASGRLHTRTRLICNGLQLQALIRKLEESPEIAFDVETTGLHEWEPNARVVTLGVSWAPGEAAVIPLFHSSSEKYESLSQVWMNYLKYVLEDKTKKFIAHNAKFDAKWMAKEGINIPVTFDTMIAAHLLDENRQKGLKPLSELLLGADNYGIDLKDTFNADLKTLAIYNGKDCDYTLRLYHIFRDQLREQPRVARLFKKLMMPASKTFTHLEMEGTYIDHDLLHARTRHAQRVVKKLESYMMKFTKQKSLNFNSPAQVGVWLFNELHLDVVEKTATGAPSTKESVLLKLSKEHQAVRALLKYRKWSKFLSTYLYPWAARLDERSRIHPSYNLARTVTGRLSSSEPNLQQVPRDPFIRGIVGSPPGWSFMEADYSQVELRLAAMLANEKTMLAILAAGEDLHTNTACAITKKQPHEITKDERVIWGKHPNFGLLFSMKPEKYQEYCANNGIYITLKEAEQVYRRFHETYPALKRWHNRVIRVAHNERQVVTAIGRVRHLPDIKSGHTGSVREAERQAINSIVQGLATDICLTAAVRLSQNLDPNHARLVGSVHDALLFEVRDEVVDLYGPLIKKVMEDMSYIYKLYGAIINVPIVVDVEVGKHWSQGTAIAA